MPKRDTDGCRAVLPELIFVQARQSPQRILDVFARVLTRHELNPTGQNRHGFKSRQPIKLRRLIKTYTANGLRRPTCLSAFGQAKSGPKPCFYSACFFANLSVLRSFSRSFKKAAVFLFGQPNNFPYIFPRFTLRFTEKENRRRSAGFFFFASRAKIPNYSPAGASVVASVVVSPSPNLKPSFSASFLRASKRDIRNVSSAVKSKLGIRFTSLLSLKCADITPSASPDGIS